MNAKEGNEHATKRVMKSLVTERISVDRWVPPWVWHQHLTRYAWVSELTKGRNVIDAACGSGYGGKILLDGGADRVECFDISEYAIRAARAKYGSDGLDFKVGDVTNLPVADATCDVFVSFETIEHVADDRAFLREVRRVLKPGGQFVCSTPNRAMTNPGTTIDHQSFNPHHLREYSLSEFDTLLRSCFDAVQLYGQRAFAFRYARVLGAVGERVPWLAARLHQARKLFGLPGEKAEKHYPEPLPMNGEPEVLIGVCSIS